MIRDIFKHKAQFVSIFLMALIGVFAFTGIGSEYIGLEVNINDYIIFHLANFENHIVFAFLNVILILL